MGRHVTFHVHSTIPFIEAGTIVCVCVGYLYTLLYTHPYAILYISVCFLLSRVLRQDFYEIAQSKKKKGNERNRDFSGFIQTALCTCVRTYTHQW